MRTVKKFSIAFAKWVFIACAVGVIGGIVGSLFHMAVNFATGFRECHSWFDEDEELVPQPAIEDHIDFGVDEGDLDEGFMAEDENGTSELEGSAASDESDLFLNDGE